MPQILYEKQELYFEGEDCPILIGAGKECKLILPESQFISQKHLEITYNLSKFYVKNLSTIEVCSQGGQVLKPGTQRLLKDQAFFIFGKPGSGKEVFIAYNASKEVHFEHINIGADPIKNEAEILVSEFYSDLNIQNIPSYICYFISRHFHITTAMIILHHVEEIGGSKWINSSEWRRDNNRRYKPSMKLLKEFIATGKPVKFDIKEDEEESTYSILTNKIKKAFFFPLMIHDQVFGALYIDTNENILSEKDFYKISYLLANGASAILKIRLEGKAEPKPELKPDKPLCDDLLSLPFQARVISEKHKYLVLSYKTNENMHRFIFADAKDILQAIQIKSFADGLQKGNWDMDTILHFSKILSEYAKVPSCDISVEFSLNCLTLSVNASDFYVGMKNIKRNLITSLEDLDSVELKRDSILLISPEENLMGDRLEISL
jgi:hypothetical protein